MKVYDLGNTQWKQLTPTSSQQTNIDAAVSNATNINNVASQISPTNNIATVAGDSTPINTLAGISGLSSLAAASSAVTNVSNNLSSVQNFADVYRVASSAPTTSLNQGDLYFDTTSNELKVYKSSGWAAAGSTVNGTSNRFKFTATSGQTTFTGNDDNSNNLAFDASFIDVYLNGVRLVNGTDCTVTSGNSIVLASGATAGDVLEAVAFGTFNLASIALNDLTDVSTGGVSDGQVLVYNNSASRFEPGAASSAEVYGFEKGFTPYTVNYTVAVQSVGGSNKYFILGQQQPTLQLLEGNTYIFDHPSAHPLRFSTDSNNSNAYTTGVTVVSSTQVKIVVATGAPTLYYYCSIHAGMGGQANTPVPQPNNLKVTTTNKGADSISQSQYAAFDDVLFSASGFTFSINSSGNLIATI